MNIGARAANLLEALHRHMMGVSVTGDFRTCTDCRDEVAKALRAAARDAWDAAIAELGFTQGDSMLEARDQWIGGVADEPAATDNTPGCAIPRSRSGAGAVAGDGTTN